LEASIENADPLVVPFATQMVDGGASVPVTPTYGAVQAKKTTNAMMQAILSGQKDVETAAKDAAAEMTATLNDQ
ncbi:MAG: sugar ABC transporter substrate-binding protein, partial [Actinomycetota bacterium]|nr:sugar ABC transporter substrate-binding protein [Actinomycetota bacterium]